jgi:hypothetical protein
LEPDRRPLPSHSLSTNECNNNLPPFGFEQVLGAVATVTASKQTKAKQAKQPSKARSASKASTSKQKTKEKKTA